VVLKSTLYRTWWAERAEPWVHYIPIDVRYSNMKETLEWLHSNPEKARAIGEAARELAMTRLRDEDLDCYVLRALFEFYSLFPKAEREGAWDLSPAESMKSK
jgi:hypothetical protein